VNKNSRILIAGHNGLIGSAFERYFKKSHFKNIIPISTKELDLTKKDDVGSFFARHKPEYVFLAAGKVGGILENSSYPADFIQKNLVIQSNVFDSSAKNKINKLVFFCSSCMYPKNAKQPMDEDLLLTGRPELTSISYAMAKLSGLYSCLAYNQQLKKQIFIPVIPNSVYGPNDNFNPSSGHVLSSLIYKFYNAKINKKRNVTLWGTGKPKREFIFVDDVVDACIFLVKKKMKYLPINIGTGDDLSIKSLANLISKKISYDGKISWDTSKPDGAERKLLSSKRINDLGWSSKTSLDKGLDLTLQWYIEKYEKKITN
jgi:GDP-L-fucose synthase